MSQPAKNNVINLDTADWAPDQVVRWVKEKVDEGEIESLCVIIEYKEKSVDEDGTVYDYIWSKATHEALWYMVSWAKRITEFRYFG